MHLSLLEPNQPICRGTLFSAEQIPASKPSFKKGISAGNVNTQKGRCRALKDSCLSLALCAKCIMPRRRAVRASLVDSAIENIYHK
jgi:hypothetical protein